MKKLVSMHNLGEKIGILHTQANGLTYQNFDNYYTHILQILSRNNIAPIDIQSLNSINEIRNPLIPKKIGNLLYLDNFALIDNNFGAFLCQISNNSKKMYQALYTSIGNKIVMSINYEYSNIYQIVSFQNDDFIVEYIIGISYNQYSNDIKHIHNLIASTILTQGPQNLNILKNGILVNNCFTFFLHELNNINKNLPPGQTINTLQQLATQMGSVSPPHVINSPDFIRHNESKEDLNNLFNDKSLGKSTSVPIKNKFINSNNSNKLSNSQINNRELKNLREDNDRLKAQLSKKENEINNLRKKLDDIMVVNFFSTDQTVHYGIICSPNDKFVDVEAKLYKKYDNLINTNNVFTCNANPILRFKTIRENNIRDGDIIQLIKIE